MPQLQPNKQFSSASCLAILSRTQVQLLDKYRELLPGVLPGIQIVCPDDLEDMRRILNNSHATHELILVIGGDGTLNRVLQHVDLQRQVLGILPSGTGNDFASFLGFPTAIQQRLAYLSGLEAQPTDMGMAGELRYINSAGFGIDTETLKERERHSGFLRNNYNLLFLLALSRMRCQDVSIEADGFSEQGRFFWMLGMNSALIGGGTRIAPDAQIDDGRLDMVLIRESSKLSMIRLMPAAIAGRHIGQQMVEYRQVPAFKVEARNEIEMIALDGECYEWKSRSLKLRCVPGSIRFLR